MLRHIEQTNRNGVKKVESFLLLFLGCSNHQVLLRGKCQQCNDGKIPNIEKTWCVCPNGQAFVNNQCMICENGKVPNLEKTVCICLDGACITCEGGKIPNNEETACLCPIEQILKNNNCEDCPGSSVPNGNQTSCVCPQWQNSGTINNQCQGSYNNFVIEIFSIQIKKIYAHNTSYCSYLIYFRVLKSKNTVSPNKGHKFANPFFYIKAPLSRSKKTSSSN